MDFIKLKLRRMRRRNRIPRGLLVSVASIMAIFVLSAAFLTLPASARTEFRMPRTDNGIVTDGDGSLGSGDVLPEGSDILPDVTSDMHGDTTLLPDVTSGTDHAGTTAHVTTHASTSGTTGNAAESNMMAWIIGLIVLAAVVIAIVLIIRAFSSSRRDR